MEPFSPSLLPTITSVEVVVLRGIEPKRVDEFMVAAMNAPYVTVDGALANRIADLWRQLPPGDQARCQVPPYGLRFRKARKVICQASLCWECNNVYGEMGGVAGHYEFDAAHSASQELLAELQRVSKTAEGGTE